MAGKLQKIKNKKKMWEKFNNLKKKKRYSK